MYVFPIFTSEDHYSIVLMYADSWRSGFPPKQSLSHAIKATEVSDIIRHSLFPYSQVNRRHFGSKEEGLYYPSIAPQRLASIASIGEAEQVLIVTRLARSGTTINSHAVIVQLPDVPAQASFPVRD